MAWTDGYISDVRYPAFFYREMQPCWLSAVANLRGFSAPAPDRPFALCELGCGVGINLLVAAACHPDAHFVGVDIDAASLAVARDAAASCGIANVTFVHMDFISFAANNHARFDFVTSHGAWSWIAGPHRAALLDIARRSLTPSGIFYLHYMCHPGSTELVALQHVLNLSAHHMAVPSPRAAKTGLTVLQHIADTGLFADNPAMLRHLANMATRDPADLAHEFLTDHWQPQHSTDVHRTMGDAGLTLIGSADVFANLDISLSVPGRLQALVRKTAVPALAEALKDMARNAHQRMDLFQKAPMPLDPAKLPSAPGNIRFAPLPGAPKAGPLHFATPIGPVVGPEAVFTPLLERLARGPADGAELSDLPAFAGDRDALAQALQLLMMQGIAHPVRPDRASGRAPVRALSHWFDRNGIALAIIEDCATAVARPA